MLDCHNTIHLFKMLCEDAVDLVLAFYGRRRPYNSNDGSYIFALKRDDPRYKMISKIPKICNKSYYHVELNEWLHLILDTGGRWEGQIAKMVVHNSKNRPLYRGPCGYWCLRHSIYLEYVN
jgi:hypothetical protein